ncbi:DUF5980 family protein [Jidongwangia harbinensis]|uniref:DUF5980 family protein n=1 Tax=Jidongwangia harbinensis TaxID=2878561 RepID=UPI001CD9FF72|nr:DUF5980 family protein [Jidongwangia harbinensis]MCA2214085.1 hypothetical protein [Jidongwangia harbinensis]
MRSTPRAVTWSLSILSGVLTLSLLGSPPAAAATSTPPAPTTWKLAEFHTRICVDAEVGRGGYFIVWIDGTWHTTLEVGVEDLPPGSTSTVTPVAPQPSEGSRATGMLWDIPPSPPGTYQGAIYAADGSVRQTIPLTVDVRTRC